MTSMLITLVETETMYKNRWITQLEIETLQSDENEILKVKTTRKGKGVKKVLTGLMSMLATTGNAPLPGLKDMVADTLPSHIKPRRRRLKLKKVPKN